MSWVVGTSKMENVMERAANVYFKDVLAGVLKQDASGYSFVYDTSYLLDKSKCSISLTLLKRKEAYRSLVLFPFFSNMLSEGANRALQCRLLKVDERDSFGLLLEIGGVDTVGAVKVKRI